jgi:hypothetical protein
VVVNIIPIAQGNQYAPGGKVLLPSEECIKAWEAWRGGNDAWQLYLKEIEPELTRRRLIIATIGAARARA